MHEPDQRRLGRSAIGFRTARFTYMVSPMRWLALPFLLLLSCSTPQQEPTGPAILIFSHTTGWRHDSIPAGIDALTDIAQQRKLVVVASEDPAIFSTAELKRFRAIILLSPTTDPKDPRSEWLLGDRRTALQQFVTAGGGILAIHAAADSHYGWSWYGKLIGARFARHPPGTPQGSVSIVAPNHPAMCGLGRAVTRADEWYFFNGYDAQSKLLITLDPASIGEPANSPAPIAWTRQVDGGRVFYTAMGHTKESYSETWFRQHLANGLDWVLQR